LEVNLYAVKFVVWRIRFGNIFCRQKKNGWSHFAMAQPSLIFPYFDFTLMNVYMNTGIK